MVSTPDRPSTPASSDTALETQSAPPPAAPEALGQDAKEAAALEGPDDPSLNRKVSVAPSAPALPYSIYTHRQKLAICCLAALAGMFSPLAANIYFPSIPELSRDFKRSVQDINITVTVYMIFQGISPTLWGAVADTKGRRPVYLACLTVFLLSNVGLALIPNTAYAGLLVLRCVSAFGSAVVIALGSGTVGDIAEPFERGRYMGIQSIGPMAGPCFGPVVGGLLSQGFGWRAIFWFLAALSGAVILPMALLFPETLRTIAGNGSIQPSGINRTLWQVIKHRNDPKPKKEDVATKPPKQVTSVFAGLKYFLEPDVAIILFFNALNYTLFYAVTTSTSSIFERQYTFLNDATIGLCYLPIGTGSLVSAVFTGRIMDGEFQAYKRRAEAKRASLPAPPPGAASEKPKDANDLAVFPLEHARLRVMPVYLGILWGSSVIYGWLVQQNVSLAGPLVFQFFIGYSITAVMQVAQVMLVDLFPGRGASITANNNLCRCLIGAAGTAAIEPLLTALNSGWTFILLAGICAAASPLMVLEWRRGIVWRASRAERNRKEEERRKEKRERKERAKREKEKAGGKTVGAAVEEEDSDAGQQHGFPEPVRRIVTPHD